MKSPIVYSGGGFDTGNLGLAALTTSVVVGLARARVADEFLVFDHSPGRAKLPHPHDCPPLDYQRQGCLWSRRVYRPDALPQIRLCARVGGLWNRTARELRRAGAMVDISGGDSFTDLYGQMRFDWILRTKVMAHEAGVQLILLPQTYGPFGTPEAERRAREAILPAAQAWARDARSFEILKELLGDAFDPERHRLGVDVAFLLPKSEPPETKLPDGLRAALAGSHPLIGVNISGLIYNDPTAARKRYGFKADYRELAIALVRWLLERDEGDVVLVPHVLAPPGVAESDPAANEVVARELAGMAGGRLHVVPPVLDASQTKWVISRCSWFCGTRMHATIAGLSSGVSTATINYSDKARGVFEGCGMGEAVVDPRQLGTQASLDAIQAIYLRREEFRQRLAKGLPRVLSTAEWQMDEIAACIRGLAPTFHATSTTGSG